MSHRLARLVAAAVLVLAACRDATAPADAATFTGRWAGQPWAATARALLVPGGPGADTLYLGGSLPVNGTIPTQALTLRLAPFHGPGEYALPGDAVEMLDLVGGDAVSSAYAGVRPLAGVVTVEAYVPGVEVRGRVRFRAVPQYGSALYGASAAFEDGRFRAEVRVFTAR